MTFFPPDPDLPEPEEADSERQPWWQAPDDELPVLLPVSETLASTEHLALGLFGVAVYSDGVEFRLEGRLRRKGLPAREWNDLCADFVGHSPLGGPVHPAGRLRFGLVLGDGEKVLAEGFPFFGGDDPSAEQEGHTLSRNSGGAGGGPQGYSSTDRLWLWPLPPEGPIEFVMQWPALGVEERRVVLDGSAMRALASRVQRFWS
ncbi:hypothetical protein CSX12_17865 [Microbacterium sp. Y-01]|jgi:hypothetical protein|uniref:hypothetical protein n=1 Tax=Microbacterium sp. Y-01 TaxID=2048898 RepID=UPI000F5FABC5|nr:hypothetical protein [Microbacterium sp. Y-01]AZH80182.1 hypothetical protein CSX12_17865 [Microbacterium sp. Y-01]